MQISRNCNSHLLQRIIQLERNAVANSHYHRRETTEINPVPESLKDEILEENVCKALFLTGVNVTPEQLRPCRYLKNETVPLSNSSDVSKYKMFFLTEKV